jgi:hypothetical protein
LEYVPVGVVKEPDPSTNTSFVPLIEKLRNDLEENSRRAQLQRKSEENDFMGKTLTQVPMPIYIG